MTGKIPTRIISTGQKAANLPLLAKGGRATANLKCLKFTEVHEATGFFFSTIGGQPFIRSSSPSTPRSNLRAFPPFSVSMSGTILSYYGSVPLGGFYFRHRLFLANRGYRINWRNRCVFSSRELGRSSRYLRCHTRWIGGNKSGNAVFGGGGGSIPFWKGR